MSRESDGLRGRPSQAAKPTAEPRPRGDARARGAAGPVPVGLYDSARRQDERLRELGARAAAVAHELAVPASLVAGSLENLEHYFQALALQLPVAPGLPAAAGAADLPRAQPQELRYLLENTPVLLSICRDAARRLVGLVDQIKRFAERPARPQIGPVDVERVLREAAYWASCTRPDARQIEIDAPPLSLALAHADGLRDALINLFANALDAVAGREAPRVWARCALIEASPGSPGPPSPAALELRVGDNGHGIAQDDRERIFEAFFTTKRSPTGGLGLGLSLAREAIEAQGGRLYLAESAGGQTEFAISLRVAGSAPPRAPAPDPAPR